jgi:RimJ/RimL family protein N-acetyltransferase
MHDIETPRLILRRFEETDFPDFCEFAIDEETCRMMGNGRITDEATARQAFDNLKREEGSYALVLKETGKVIGNLNVDSLPPTLVGRKELEGKNGVALSFSISRNYRRKGLMTEAVQAVIDRLFQVEGLDFINCGYFDFNTSSRLLQEKLGFTFLVEYPNPWGKEPFHIIDNILWRENQH